MTNTRTRTRETPLGADGSCPPGWRTGHYFGGEEVCFEPERYVLMPLDTPEEQRQTWMGHDFADLTYARGRADEATMRAVERGHPLGAGPWAIWDTRRRRFVYVGRASLAYDARAVIARKTAAKAGREEAECMARAIAAREAESNDPIYGDSA